MVNELLPMLPTEIQESIHMLFIIMWATGFTPKAWKISNTTLINKNKKGDETKASSYRPIGLANTLYKLWTRLIINTLYEYAEANSILSTTQAGFSQTNRHHSPARKRDYGIRRCQTLSQRRLCPYCGFHLSFQYH